MAKRNIITLKVELDGEEVFTYHPGFSLDQLANDVLYETLESFVTYTPRKDGALRAESAVVNIDLNITSGGAPYDMTVRDDG